MVEYSNIFKFKGAPGPAPPQQGVPLPARPPPHQGYGYPPGPQNPNYPPPHQQQQGYPPAGQYPGYGHYPPQNYSQYPPQVSNKYLKNSIIEVWHNMLTNAYFKDDFEVTQH